MAPRQSKREKQREKQKLRKKLGKSGIDTNTDKKPQGFGGIGETLKKRRKALRQAMAGSSGPEKARLRKLRRESKMSAVRMRGDPKELEELEAEARELAERRLKQRKEESGGDKGEEDEEDEDPISPMDMDEDDDDDNDNGGGPSAGPVAQVIALTNDTILPIR